MKGSMHYNDLVPELGVLDFEKSITFYTSVLGFVVEYSRSEHRFAFLSLGGSQLMIEQVSGTSAATEEEISAGAWRTATLERPLGRGMSLSIRVPSLDDIVGRLSAASYPLTMKPREAWYRRDRVLIGERQLLVADPDGYLIRFQQPLGERPIVEKV